LKPVHSSKPDFEIIASVLAGDVEIFKILVDRYKDMVAGIVMNMVKDKDIANDVGQEVFIRLFRSLNKFKGEAKLSTYIGRIAINLSLNQLKKDQIRNERYPGVGDKLNFTDTNGRFDDRLEAKEILDKALQQLSPEHRSVITLRYIEGFSTKETSVILSVPEGTILSRLSRGLKHMKKSLRSLGFEAH
jgi:RNA polymerase sigma-70 factor, ECF subfamily